MRQVLTALFVLTFTTISSAITTQEVIQLSKLKTSDELLMNLIQKSPLDKPIASQDVALMKDAGVSERVIAYLLKASNPEKVKLPEQEGESVWISENLRIYRTRDKNGKMVEVVTNLDEQGKRVGGEVPVQPSSPEERYPEYVPEEPREIYITVRHEESGDRDYGSSEDTGPVYGGIPFYSGGYYPGAFLPRPHCKPRPPLQGSPNGSMWQTRSRGPIVRPSAQPSSRPAVRSTFSGSRPVQIRH